MRGLALARPGGMFSAVTAALILAHGAASAATLVLKDGSVVRGDIRTLQDSVYTVETESLGTVRVREQDIRSIDLADESARGASARSSGDASARQASPRPSGDEPPAGPGDVQALQSRILQSPDLFSMIQALQSDPEVQAVLADPEITKAVASGDFSTLMSNPKIIALLDNANVREVIDGVH